MSLIHNWRTVDQNRVDDLVEHYSKSPLVIWAARSVFTTLWYAALWEVPADILPKRKVQSAAMRQAREETQEKTRWILCLRPLEVNISPEDLEKIQEADNNMFFINHQAQADIPRTCELLGKILGTHANTHFVMKPWVPFPWIFKAGWWIVLKRWRDLKKETETWKVDNRWHLLNPDELPSFFEAFMKTPGRNIVVYSQWTRAKWKTEQQRVNRAFNFNPRVIWAMTKHIESTPNAQHVCIAFDYRDDDVVWASIKVLSQEEKEENKLSESVNWFLEIVKNKIVG